MHAKKKATTKREANRNRQKRKRQGDKERKGILKLTSDSHIILSDNCQHILDADRQRTESEVTRTKPAASSVDQLPVPTEGQRFDSQPFMVDRGIVMPDILHADRQPTAPNESEVTRTKPAASSVEQVPVPRSTI